MQSKAHCRVSEPPDLTNHHQTTSRQASSAPVGQEAPGHVAPGQRQDRCHWRPGLQAPKLHLAATHLTSLARRAASCSATRDSCRAAHGRGCHTCLSAAESRHMRARHTLWQSVTTTTPTNHGGNNQQAATAAAHQVASMCSIIQLLVKGSNQGPGLISTWCVIWQVQGWCCQQPAECLVGHDCLRADDAPACLQHITVWAVCQQSVMQACQSVAL